MIEIRKSGEEPHDFGFVEDVRKDAEVMAELRKGIKVHHASLVGVVLEVRKN